MLRVTQDVVEIRRWAELRGARPCRHPETGRLALALPGDPCAEEIGWDEFEPAFMWLRAVCVYDDAPGARASFVGAEDEAHAFLCGRAGAPGAAHP